VSSSAIAKSAAEQKAVSFTLTSTNDGDWRVYGAATGGDALTGVSASFNFGAKTLTLSASGDNLAAGTYYVTVTESGKSESLRLALTVENPPPAGAIQVTFAKPADETITLNGAGQSLSLSGAKNSITVTVTETFGSYMWFKDGVSAGVTANSITLTAAELGKGAHTIAVKVVKNNVSYSKTVKFTVTD
jgi:hypothetical protein